MSFPVILDPTVPPDSETPQAGALRIRNLTQAVIDLLGLPAAPTPITQPPFTITAGGSVAYAQGAPGALLNNGTGGTLITGDVAAIDATVDRSVALSDFSGSLAQFVVALGTVAPSATGPFASQGPVAIVKTTGAIVRGHYLRKAAASLAVEDTGISEASATPAPTGAIAVAMSANAGPTGTCAAYMLGSTAGAGSGSGGSARVFRSTVQGIPTGVVTPISFDSVRYNNGTVWAIGNPTRLTAPVTGRYLIGGSLQYAAVSAGFANVSVRVNGTTPIVASADIRPSTSTQETLSVNTIYLLNATDYVELAAFHNASGSVNILVAGNQSPEFWMELLGA